MAEVNAHEVPKSPSVILSVAALGVVFGDIGTSPLYTFKTVLDLTGATPDAAAIVGSASLILWTLVIITSVKYVGFRNAARLSEFLKIPSDQLVEIGRQVPV